MLQKVKNFLSREDGASAVEYGLIVGLIAVLLVIVLGAIGGNLNDLFTMVSDALKNAVTSGTP